MARIRTIKPEFWTSEQIVECSPTARLLFIGMWNFSDDGGNLPASIKGLKLRVFPGDDLNLTKVDGMIKELIQQHLLMEYYVNGSKYWHITGWHHQKIEKPSMKYPQPLTEHSTTIPRQLDDDLPADVSSSEGIVKEGSGRDSSSAEPKTSHAPVTFRFPLNDKSLYDITKIEIEKWRQLYPAVDVEQQCRAMIGWLDANPTKRKTKLGIVRFINSWLTREQDKPHYGGANGIGEKQSRLDRAMAKIQVRDEQDAG